MEHNYEFQSYLWGTLEAWLRIEGRSAGCKSGPFLGNHERELQLLEFHRRWLFSFSEAVQVERLENVFLAMNLHI